MLIEWILRAGETANESSKQASERGYLANSEPVVGELYAEPWGFRKGLVVQVTLAAVSLQSSGSLQASVGGDLPVELFAGEGARAT